ncbi:cell adhesion molecule 2a isoform X1 [Tachysurus ichikawai]
MSYSQYIQLYRAKEVNASGKTFTVRSSVQLKVDRNDDGVAYTCKVVHEALRSIQQQATEVLEVHYAPRVEIRHSLSLPQEGDILKLECVSNGNPSPDPVKWTKDGGKLPDLDRVIVDGRDLTFISLNKTDNGTYRCEASNHLGTNHAEYVLFVYDAPTTPSPSTTPPHVAILPDTTDQLDFKPDSAVTGQRAAHLSVCDQWWDFSSGQSGLMSIITLPHRNGEPKRCHQSSSHPR